MAEARDADSLSGPWESCGLEHRWTPRNFRKSGWMNHLSCPQLRRRHYLFLRQANTSPSMRIRIFNTLGGQLAIRITSWPLPWESLFKNSGLIMVHSARFSKIPWSLSVLQTTWLSSIWEGISVSGLCLDHLDSLVQQTCNFYDSEWGILQCPVLRPWCV